MPLFMCQTCGTVENTALSNYWVEQIEATRAKRDPAFKCSACDPGIGHWHNEFKCRPAVGMILTTEGFLYDPTEWRHVSREIRKVKVLTEADVPQKGTV